MSCSGPEKLEKALLGRRPGPFHYFGAFGPGPDPAGGGEGVRNEIKGPGKNSALLGKDPRKRARERGPLAAPCYTPQMLSPAVFRGHRGCFLFFFFFLFISDFLRPLCYSPDNAGMLPVFLII